MPAVIHVHSFAGGLGIPFSSVRYWPRFSSRTIRLASSRAVAGRPSSPPTVFGWSAVQAACCSGSSPFHQSALAFGLPSFGGCGRESR